MRHRPALPVLALTAALALGTAAPAQAADVVISGPDRYATAAAVSRAFVGDRYAPVYLATGEDFPDALAASAAAAADGSRVLLTGRDEVPRATLDELANLDPTAVYLVGGTSSVGTAVEAELQRLGHAVVRVDGPDRYATAVRVARTLFDDPGTVFLATGENYPDALAGAAAAGSLGAPVLLVGRDSLPGAVRSALSAQETNLPLRPSRFVVLGGQDAVSGAVLDEIRALGYGDAVFERIAGADRYATAAEVGRRFFPGTGTAVLAVGSGFADALAAGPLAADLAAPLLLTGAGTTPAATRAELDRRGAGDRLHVGAARPS
ncbi:cell wall-binding repeat-containing protein [Paenibacillus sp. TRM 82003]|uniref:cell wall-binding repeat-containing protein n=1 Tax=Kineococcus sp. TRM81007 TaxID=2925831 RepID=UPI001F5ABBC7|nr:cell wall-binding repeat-containing protein [Kineococcus sp. TRM81007]MCI2239622.1 cell wall-binding repeat-containing protein [Kineococcus sp. TRM81007]MCI3926096.1 cell wall-binding repeat-containing protein [Paenibacillus sp. TRM 82003]